MFGDHPPARITLSRRSLLIKSGSSLAAIALGPSLLAMSRPLSASLAQIGELQAPDHNGIRLPAGFTSRRIAAAGHKVLGSAPASTDYVWHTYPDGGASFDAGDGGWIYVSNSETLSAEGGGVSAIRFDAEGSIKSAYRILGGTNCNCAGGATPWGTWLSCEEVAFGRVFECDPFGNRAAVARPALGHFRHEAVAVDMLQGFLYLTEDEPDGRLYRFIPAGIDSSGQLNLDAGVLQVACVGTNGRIRWARVPNPCPTLSQTPTRKQIVESTPFNGGEGIWYAKGTIHFTTKGDNRVWALDTTLDRLAVIYDAATAANPVLTGVDNLTGSSGGDLLVAEDGGDMQIVVIDRQGNTTPLLQVTGQNNSEITGPAFSPNGSRLYFSSQRGAAIAGGDGLGVTYEISGPFNQFITL